MLHDSHMLHYLVNERMKELRSRAAAESVVAAIHAEKRRAKREAALAAIKRVIEAKEERAVSSWQSQRQSFGQGRLRGAR